MNVDAIHTFVTGLKDHFSPPKHGTAEAERSWLRAIIEALQGASPEVLARAKQRIIETRKNRYFPLIAEIREACRHAADEVDFDRRAHSFPALAEATGTGVEWSTERVKLAYDLIRTQQGKEASRDGWNLALWNFVRKNGKAPQGAEIERRKREAREFDQSYALCVRGMAGPLSGSLEQLGASMLAKRKELSDIAMGRAT